MLTGAMFMLEIYDRVLPSRSVPTPAGGNRSRTHRPRSSWPDKSMGINHLDKVEIAHVLQQLVLEYVVQHGVGVGRDHRICTHVVVRGIQ
jgi:hypothetical protein